jgi:cytochrome b561
MSAKAHAVKVLRDRYSTVAIIFHWLIAACIVIQIALGWRMGDVEGIGHSTLLQVHKSVGISILVLTVARLAWRMVNPPPPHGTNLHKLEKMAAHYVHVGFYAMLFLLPLTGWAMVSLQRPGSFKIFGGLPWPSLPGAGLVPSAVADNAADTMDTVHGLLVWVMLALLALHVAGALKHQFISKDRTIARMAPGVEPGSFTDKRLWSIPIVVALIAAVIYLPKLPVAREHPKPKDVASANIYTDIVGPSLERRCGFCHSEDVSKGGLDLTSYEAVMAGGRDGKVVIPGHPEKSDLYRRITLPMDHAQYMPKDGKPPLGKSEISAIQWWIAQGAPRSAKVSTLKLTPEANSALKTLISGADDSDDNQGGGGGTAIALPTAPPADKAVIAKLQDEGFIVRKAALNSNAVFVDYILTKAVTPEALADLGKLSQQIYTLNLRKAQVTDAQAKTLAAFPNLTILRLEENAITDAGVKDIASTAKKLTYLNLTGTKVTDAGFEAALGIPGLQRLYVWNTAVTPDAVKKAKDAHKGMDISAGLTAKDVVPDTKVLTPTN